MSMTYRGIVSKGVVVVEGEQPPEGTVVKITPLAETASLAHHPAIGIWKNRTDLPEDPVEASKVLRQRLMRRADE